MGEEDEELAELRKKKMQQLKSQQEQMAAAEERSKALEEKKQVMLWSILTPEARERLGRVKVAYPEIVKEIENQLVMLASSGRLNQKIDDETLKQILKKMMPEKRDISIERR